MNAPEHRGSCYDQFADRLNELASDFALRLFHLIENLSCGGDVDSAGIGQHDFAGRAREQARAKQGLQFGNPAAQRWQRYPHRPPGSGEATMIDNFQQHRHGLEAIHPILSINEIVISSRNS